MLGIVKPVATAVTQNAIPAYLREQNPNLVAFLKHYYEWMSKDGNVLDFLQNMVEYRDIGTVSDDTNSQYFTELIVNQLADFIPAASNINRALFVSHIRDFYKSKGTLPSYEFILNALFNSTADIVWNSDKVLRPSSNNAVRESMMFTYSTLPWDATVNGSFITQTYPTVASAVVDLCTPTIINGKVVNALTLNPESVVGSFAIGGLVQVLKNTVDRSFVYVSAYYSAISLTNSTLKVGISVEVPRSYPNLIVKQLGSNFRAKITSLSSRVIAGGRYVLTFTINSKTGTFGTGDLYFVDATLENSVFTKADYLTGTISPTIVDIDIVNGGALNDVGDIIEYTGGSGSPMTAKIYSVGGGSVDTIIPISSGYGYSVGDALTFTAVDGIGGGMSAEVSSVDGINAQLSEYTELDGFNIRDGGHSFFVGDLITIQGGSTPISASPTIFRVTSINSNLGLNRVQVVQGGSGYSYTHAMMINRDTNTVIPNFAANVITQYGIVTAVNVTQFPTLTTQNSYVIINGNGATITTAMTANMGISSQPFGAAPFSGDLVQATTGIIQSVVVTNGGFNYINPQVVVHSASQPIRPATFSISKDVNGTITGVTVVDGGLGYPDVITLEIVEMFGSGVLLNTVINAASGPITGLDIVDRGTYSLLPRCFETPYSATSIETQFTAGVSSNGFSSGPISGGPVAGGTSVSSNDSTIGLSSQAISSGPFGGGTITGASIPTGSFATTLTVQSSGADLILDLKYRVKSVFLSNPGSYYRQPVIDTSYGIGQDASFIPQIANGVIKTINVISGGSGYTYATVAIIGTGVGFKGVVNLIPVGVVSTTDGMAISAAPISDNAIGGNSNIVSSFNYVASITILDGGVGYSPTDQIVIYGDGVGAIASMTLVTSGTAQVGTTNSITLAPSASSTPDIYANKSMTITSGTGVGQSRNVIASRNNALSLVAANSQYVTIANQPAMNNLGDWSVECWVVGNSFHSVYNVDVFVTNQYTGGSLPFVIGQNINGVGGFGTGFFDGHLWYSASSGTIPTTGTLYHLVGIRRGLNLELWVNGVLTATTVLSSAPPISTSLPLYIGKRWDLGDYFNGTIDEVRIYNRAISTSEVAMHYAQTGFSYSGLLAYYPFNEISGTTTADASGNGNTGTLVGAPSFVSGIAHATTVIVDTPWTTVPDATSLYTINTVGTVDGVIKQIIVANGGKNYAYDTTFNYVMNPITFPSAVAGTFTPIIADGVIKSINVINGGSGYSIQTNDLKNEDGTYLLMQDTSKIAFNSPYDVPNAVGGVPAIATISAAGTGSILSANIISGGSGYYSLNEIAPLEIYLNSITGFGAVVAPVLEHGRLVSFKILSSGTGYSLTDTISVIGGGTGSGAVLTPVFNAGKLIDIIVVNSGSGYRYGTSALVVGNGRDADIYLNVNTSITQISVINGGSGYTSPTVKITDTTGNGIGASAIAVVVNGVVTGITLLSGGTGYVAPVITLIDTTGVGAVLTAEVLRYIEGITIHNTGSNYTFAEVYIIGDGNGANITVEIEKNGSIYNPMLEYQGTGYVDNPNFVVTDISGYGAITGVKVLEGGSQFIKAPIVTIPDKFVGNTLTATGARFVSWGQDIGAVTGVAFTQFGGDWYEAPKYNFSIHTVMEENVNFVVGETVKVANYPYAVADNTFSLLIEDITQFQGHITGTTLYVTNNPNGSIGAGDIINGAGIAPNTRVVKQLTGPINTNSGFSSGAFSSGALSGESDYLVGGYGTYQVTNSQNIATIAMSAAHADDGWSLFGEYKLQPLSQEVDNVSSIMTEDGFEIVIEDTGFVEEEFYEITNLDGTLSPYFDKGPTAVVNAVDFSSNTLELSSASDALIIASESGDIIISENNIPIVDQTSNGIIIGDKLVGQSSQSQATILWFNRTSGVPISGGIGFTKKAQTNSTGILNHPLSMLQDGKRIQDYAYVVRTGASLDQYKDVLTKNVHPAGYEMFGDVVLGTFGGNVTVTAPTTFGVKGADSSFYTTVNIKNAFVNMNLSHNKNLWYYNRTKQYFYTTQGILFSGYTFNNYDINSINFITNHTPLATIEPWYAKTFQYTGVSCTTGSGQITGITSTTGVALGYRVIAYNALGANIFVENKLKLETGIDYLKNEDGTFLNTDEPVVVVTAFDGVSVTASKNAGETDVGTVTIAVQDIPSLYLA